MISNEKWIPGSNLKDWFVEHEGTGVRLILDPEINFGKILNDKDKWKQVISIAHKLNKVDDGANDGRKYDL